MTSELGLRERKKQATRTALGEAAWSMMIEGGYDAATPESVAEAAGVSPRTFRNYFASVDEAILDGVVQRAGTVLDALRARPADEPVWDSLAHVLPETVGLIVGDRDDVCTLMRLREENPALLAQHLTVYERLDRALLDILAERTGTDAGRDATPHLLAAVVAVSMQTSIALWAEGDTDADLADLVRGCLTQFRAGLPVGAEVPPLTT